VNNIIYIYTGTMTSMNVSLVVLLLLAAIGAVSCLVSSPPIRATLGMDAGPGAGHYIQGYANPYMSSTPTLQFTITPVAGTSPQLYTVQELNPAHYPSLCWSAYDSWDGNCASETYDQWQFQQIDATHWNLYNPAYMAYNTYGWGVTMSTPYGPYGPVQGLSSQAWLIDGYYGCYQDAAVRDFAWEAYPFQSTITNTLTIEQCRTHCGLFGYSYAALQWSVQCFCGNNFGTYGKTAESNCNMACSGNSAETCGGPYANSVYTAIKSRYIGCYNDNTPRDLNHLLWDATVNPSSFVITIEHCMDGCKALGYQYAGLQYGLQCFCGNSYGSYGLAPAGYCNYPCKDDTSETCGNGWTNQVYNSGLGMSYPN